MSVSNLVLIASAEAASAIETLLETAPDASLEDRFVAAIGATRSHWLATSEEDRFKGAVGGLIRTASEEERERIVEEMRAINRASAMLTAMQAGVPLDIELLAFEAEAESERERIGLMEIWRREIRK